MRFSPVRKLKVAHQVVDALRDAIIGGKYAEGDALPSERELATQFGVNRSSIREALLRLEAWGLVQIKQGGATRVRDIFYSSGLQILPYLLAPGGRMNKALLRDILSFRVMFLAWAAEEASSCGDPEQLAELDRLVEQLDGCTSPAVAQELDFVFFQTVVAMTGNKVAALFTKALGDVYQENTPDLLFLYDDVPFDASAHRSTFAAIARGDGEAAALAMKRYGRRAVEAHRNA